VAMKPTRNYVASAPTRSGINAIGYIDSLRVPSFLIDLSTMFLLNSLLDNTLDFVDLYLKCYSISVAAARVGRKPTRLGIRGIEQKGDRCQRDGGQITETSVFFTSPDRRRGGRDLLQWPLSCLSLYEAPANS
jgi:hypothetical protein